MTDSFDNVFYNTTCLDDLPARFIRDSAIFQPIHAYFTDYIRHGTDNGLFTAMVMIDLQKVFDTINHSLLQINLKL